MKILLREPGNREDDAQFPGARPAAIFPDPISNPPIQLNGVHNSRLRRSILRQAATPGRIFPAAVGPTIAIRGTLSVAFESGPRTCAHSWPTTGRSRVSRFRIVHASRPNFSTPEKPFRYEVRQHPGSPDLTLPSRFVAITLTCPPQSSAMEPNHGKIQPLFFKLSLLKCHAEARGDRPHRAVPAGPKNAASPRSRLKELL